MGNLTEIQKLVKRQKSYMKGLLVMTEKLFDIQNQIAELNLREIKKSQTNSNIETDLLSSGKVCKLLGISSSTLYRMRINDEFPSVKIEGRKNVMFQKSEIKKFINKTKSAK